MPPPPPPPPPLPPPRAGAPKSNSQGPSYAVLVGETNGDGARRGLVTIVDLIDPRPYMLQVIVYVVT